MDRPSYNPWRHEETGSKELAHWAALLTALLVVAGAALFLLFPPISATNTGVPVSRKVSPLVFPASTVRIISSPAGGKWLLPAGSAILDGSIFVLDTGNDRILKLDGNGNIIDVFGHGNGLPLAQPMAIATDGRRLFVANSLASQVLIMRPSGQLERSVQLEAGPGEEAPRPIGIAAGANNTILVSDANNHRVLFLDDSGRVLISVGAGTRAGGRDGFNVPAAIATDASGNIYVADTLNGRVVKLSPEGAYLQEYGRLADTAGSLGRPKGVAVDAAGRVYVSDGLQAAVEVFAPDGTYLGVIGRKDPSDPRAGPIFEAPGALLITGDELQVTDAVVGLVTLRIEAPSGPAVSP